MSGQYGSALRHSPALALPCAHQEEGPAGHRPRSPLSLWARPRSHSCLGPFPGEQAARRLQFSIPQRVQCDGPLRFGRTFFSLSSLKLVQSHGQSSQLLSSLPRAERSEACGHSRAGGWQGHTTPGGGSPNTPHRCLGKPRQASAWCSVLPSYNIYS